MYTFYKRDIDKRINSVIKGFPIVSLSGPRQSGKTTYIKERFNDYEYFNLERLSDYEYITSDPGGFLKQHPKNIILDEVQKFPELLSYLQVHVDERQEMGSIILSGSQNLLLIEKITQSLAGRVAHIPLYPFSMKELLKHSLLDEDIWSQIIKGFYPALYVREVSISEFYNSYITTFVERDVRLIKNIGNLTQFKRFMIILAGRVGQLLDYASIANDVGVSPNTIKDWVSVLEASYVVFRLPPYFANQSKRLVRSPKIYFYDVGLLCALLGIDNKKELLSHYARGGIFENLIIAEFKKTKYEYSISSQLYFYRDSNGVEVDLLIDKGTEIVPIEIKSASDFTNSFLKTITSLQAQKIVSEKGFVVYTGEKVFKIDTNNVVPWNKLSDFFHGAYGVKKNS